MIVTPEVVEPLVQPATSVVEPKVIIPLMVPEKFDKSLPPEAHAIINKDSKTN